ncbi:hypothetical protein L3X38_018334 [Prunus dulcis]|uniref:Ankyrin repeat family protein n=1 Tax=Prunus dulcis TaxID=3755 RepID=A0AAD4WBJ4_PRUDU|nr:hypothetical protein L3X38_018334 [Prunus dulcis]
MELRNSSDQNIPHVAARSGEDNLVKYFFKKVEFQMLINQKDNRGNTPLHVAKTYDHPKVVHLFMLDTRINLKVLNDRGMTALGISESTLETCIISWGLDLVVDQSTFSKSVDQSTLDNSIPVDLSTCHNQPQNLSSSVPVENFLQKQDRKPSILDCK